MKKMPPWLLVALGLGCGPAVETDTSDSQNESQGESQTGPMTESGPPDPTSPPDPTTPPDPTLPPDPTDPTATGCLSPPFGSSSGSGGVNFIDPETGPCLSVVSTTGGDTDTDTDTDSGSGTSTGTSGGADAPPPDRAELLDRLEESGVLPPDLLRRLRGPKR